MTMQQFRTIDSVRLEVKAAAAPGQNILRSPDFSLGAWPWTSKNTADVITPATWASNPDSGGRDTSAAVFAMGSTDPWMYSEYFPVTPERYCLGRVFVKALTRPPSPGAYAGKPSINFYDANYNLLGPVSAAPAAFTTAGTLYAVTGVVPPQAAYATLSLQVTANLSGSGIFGNPPYTNLPGTRIMVSNAMALDSATAFTSPYPAYNDGAARWVNLLGDSSSLDISRATMDASTLTASLINPALDPATGNGLLSRGRPVRVTANDPVTDTWVPIFTGYLEDARTQYVLDKTAPDGSQVRTITTITGHDGLSAVGNIPSPNIPSRLADISSLLAAFTIDTLTGDPAITTAVSPPMAWSLNGYTGSPATPNPPAAVRSNATALDGVLIARDTATAEAWVDRYGVLNIWDAGTGPGDSPDRVGFTDDTGGADSLYWGSYSAIEVGYDPAAIVNAVTIVNLGNDPTTGEETQAQFGPYVDQSSINTNGARSLTITTANPAANATWAGDYAADILATNAQPKRKVTQITVPVIDSWGIHHAAVIDLTSRVNLIYGSLINDSTGEHRVNSITHSLTANGMVAEKWLTTYTFADAAAQAQPLQVLTGGIPVSVTETGWRPLPYVSGWADYTPAGWSHGRYKREGDWLYIVGMMTGPAMAAGAYTTLANLPTGYRPPAVNAAGYVMGAGLLMGRVIVAPTGVVQVVYTAAQAAGGLHEINVALPLD